MSDWVAKRFWTEATSMEVEGGFAIYLDGRPVKTPAKSTLVVPTLALAQEITVEWDAQVEKINPTTMPMTRFTNAAIDKVSTQKTEVAELIAAYGESDLLCYRADGPQELVARQAHDWDPILGWAAEKYGAVLMQTNGVMHVTQPANSVEILKQLVTSQDVFALTALHDLVSLSGSLVIGLAAQEKAFDLAHLWQVSRLDEVWQIEKWGDDEDASELAAAKESSFFHAHPFFAKSRNF